MKKIFKLVLACLLAVSMFACGEKVDTSINGTFTGTSAGMQGNVTVEMTIEAGIITNVVVTESKESAHVTDVALERIPAQMVEHQTCTVDTVTGATLTSNALMRAAKAAAESAGMNMKLLEKNAYHAKAGEAETWNADVLVVGGGGAGFAAAISAAQEGSKVILIEKSSFFGGNTYMAGGAFNAVDREAQATRVLTVAEKNTLDSYLALTEADEALHFDLFPEWKTVLAELQADITAHYAANQGKTAGVDMPGYDSVALHMWHIYVGGLRQMSDGRWVCSNIELARTLAENALASYEWAGSLGVTTASRAGASLSTVLGAMWPRTHSYSAGAPLVEALVKAATAEGVELYTEIAADSLIVDENNKVIGATAVKADGTKVTVNTTNGVVLASGGYCANPAMVKEHDEYWGDDLTATTLTTNVGTNDGDGIIMAQAIGADVVDMGVTQMMPSSSPIKGTMTDGLWGDASAQIWVDKDGNRFVNEYAERDVLAKASLELDGGIFYIIFAGYMPQADGTYAGVDMSGFFGTMLKGYEGHVWYGSTLAELAEAAKTPIGGVAANFTEESLRTTIEKYNSYVAAQNDPDFGKEVLAGAIDLEAFEADENLVLVISPRKASLHHSMGGVVINTNCEVLTAEGNAIEGLWAAGEVAGGVHAGNRLGGNAIADIFTFGKIAGKNAGAK